MRGCQTFSFRGFAARFRARGYAAHACASCSQVTSAPVLLHPNMACCFCCYRRVVRFFILELSSKMFNVKCFNRCYYPVSIGNSNEGHKGKDRTEEITQDDFIGKSNFCLKF